MKMMVLMFFLILFFLNWIVLFVMRNFLIFGIFLVLVYLRLVFGVGVCIDKSNGCCEIWLICEVIFKFEVVLFIMMIFLFLNGLGVW